MGGLVLVTAGRTTLRTNRPILCFLAQGAAREAWHWPWRVRRLVHGFTRLGPRTRQSAHSASYKTVMRSRLGVAIGLLTRSAMVLNKHVLIVADGLEGTGRTFCGC